MYFSRKLRPKSFTPEFLLPFIILFPFFILLKIFGAQAAYLFLIPFFIMIGLVGLILWTRTGNAGHFILMLVMLLVTVMSIYL